MLMISSFGIEDVKAFEKSMKSQGRRSSRNESSISGSEGEAERDEEEEETEASRPKRKVSIAFISVLGVY
jgi:hypothetical protein